MYKTGLFCLPVKRALEAPQRITRHSYLDLLDISEQILNNKNFISKRELCGYIQEKFSRGLGVGKDHFLPFISCHVWHKNNVPFFSCTQLNEVVKLCSNITNPRMTYASNISFYANYFLIHEFYFTYDSLNIKRLGYNKPESIYILFFTPFVSAYIDKTKLIL